MEDITSTGIASIMKVAPVWAASLAGRTKIFTDPACATAYVTGGRGRFKIVINPSLATGNDLVFILMHEISHIFRRDLVSMQKHPALAQKINVAADCIINDSLIKMGIVKPSIYKNMCWGRDLFKMDCSDKSINQLIDAKYDEKQAEGKATKPGNVSEEGETIEGSEGQGGGTKRGSGGVGAGEDPCTEIGLGKDPYIHTELKPMAKSLAAYARKMFFEAGFKSKNYGTKNDWRRNRSAFASRTDIVIPRTKYGEMGKEREGPLVNLVLDVSGSMHHTWVATAAAIAQEVKRAGLDYDLWLTPVRRKAKDPDKLLNLLKNGMDYQKVDAMCEPMAHEGLRHRGSQAVRQIKGTPTRGGISKDFDSGTGADELEALALFHTTDPVVWVYVGDYKSRMNLQMHGDPNFLHVMMKGRGKKLETYGPSEADKLMKQRSLPRWIYEVGH